MCVFLSHSRSHVFRFLFGTARTIATVFQRFRNEVNVPPELKKKLEESVQGVMVRSGCETHTELLVEHSMARRSSIEENETVKLIRELHRKLKSKVPNFSLRIKDGSYTVTNYLEGESNQKGDTEDGPHRAKQKIATVKTESPVYKLRKLLGRCIKGEIKREKQEVVIMDQVNLAFEPGKMYLVL